MFKLVVACALLATVLAEHHGHVYDKKSESGHAGGHSTEDAHAETKHYESHVHDHGFQYAFETSNHIKGAAEGDEHGNIRGNFEWISPEGKPIGVDYLADENGYQPQSDVLPKGHPIPPAILKSLEYIASHPPVEAKKAHSDQRF